MYQITDFPKLKGLRVEHVSEMPQRIVSENGGKKVTFKNGITGAVFSQGFKKVPVLDPPVGYVTALFQHKEDGLVWIAVYVAV